MNSGIYFVLPSATTNDYADENLIATMPEQSLTTYSRRKIILKISRRNTTRAYLGCY